MNTPAHEPTHTTKYDPIHAPRYRRLSAEQIVDIGNFLATVCPKLENGMAEYIDAWSDETVAERFGVMNNSVATLRLKLRGKLQVRTYSAKNTDLIGRINNLQGQVDTLSAKLSELVSKYDRLVLSLALNRVANVGHLTVDAVNPAVVTSPAPVFTPASVPAPGSVQRLPRVRTDQDPAERHGQARPARTPFDLP